MQTVLAFEAQEATGAGTVDGPETTTDENRIRLESGSTRVEDGREGRVETGMPLHGSGREGDAEFVIDHEEASRARTRATRSGDPAAD